jgi:hypothetical protein
MTGGQAEMRPDRQCSVCQPSRESDGSDLFHRRARQICRGRALGARQRCVSGRGGQGRQSFGRVGWQAD